jgi:hypothetical protein
MDIGSNLTARCYVMRNIGTYFTGKAIILAKGSINEAGRCFSPDAMQKCILHNLFRYQNIRSRDPITLLSMDIVVETFLEIGVSDLLVLARRLQDSLYGSMRNVLILKYWARKAKNHGIPQYLANHVSCRVTHVAHHTIVFTFK